MIGWAADTSHTIHCWLSFLGGAVHTDQYTLLFAGSLRDLILWRDPTGCADADAGAEVSAAADHTSRTVHGWLNRSRDAAG